MFDELLNAAQITAAGIFAESDADGRRERAWFYPDASKVSTAVTAESFTVEIGQNEGFHSSARRFDRMDVTGLVKRENNTFSVAFRAAALPYRPINGVTVFYLGFTPEDARRCRVADHRVSNGQIEIEAQDT